MKKDKWRRAVVINREKCFNKCLAMLSTEKFVQLQNDPASSLERKGQRTLRKIKQKLPRDVCAKLYRTESFLGKFYGTAKVHKLLITDTFQNLPLRQIISKLNTAMHKSARYVAKILSPLSLSQYNIESSNKFANMINSRSFQAVTSSYHLMKNLYLQMCL